MLKNYIKVAFRNLFRKKLYSFLNITGLAIGFACSFLILFYIQDELSFDRFHANADRIYRVEADLTTTERSLRAATSANPLGPMLQAERLSVQGHVGQAQTDEPIRRDPTSPNAVARPSSTILPAESSAFFAVTSAFLVPVASHIPANSAGCMPMTG